MLFLQIQNIYGSNEPVYIITAIVVSKTPNIFYCLLLNLITSGGSDNTWSIFAKVVLR